MATSCLIGTTEQCNLMCFWRTADTPHRYARALPNTSSDTCLQCVLNLFRKCLQPVPNLFAQCL
ncbi:hypothetical protein D9F15_23560 [Escherichia coli]|nr:hypothetical protein [Escherichia coli]